MIGEKIRVILTLSWRRPLSYRNQSINLLHKSMDWFLYDSSFRHEKVKDDAFAFSQIITIIFAMNIGQASSGSVYIG